MIEFPTEALWASAVPYLIFYVPTVIGAYVAYRRGMLKERYQRVGVVAVVIGSPIVLIIYYALEPSWL